MGSGTHSQKIDGFPGTHGTHANGATVKTLGYKEYKLSCYLSLILLANISTRE